MNIQSLPHFIRSTTARLAASYLAIIMVLSIGFSFVFYNTSANELGRQVPPPSDFEGYNLFGKAPDYHTFFQQRIAEGQDHLLRKLFLLNLLALILGMALSYYLARRTLKPIENAMEAQSRFVADASHELRTPLTAVLASNEVALRKPKLNLAQAKDVLRSNVEEMTKLKGLSEGLLSLAQREDDNTLVLIPVSLQDVASEAMNWGLKAAQAKQIAIQDAVPDIKVLGDMQSLVQATAILLDNAIKYSPKGSTIHLSGSEDGIRGLLSVQDEGIGISVDDLPHIFDRFYQSDLARSKSEVSGYGIGLSIAHKILEQHNGKISVTSKPKKGSVFKLEIPLATL